MLNKPLTKDEAELKKYGASYCARAYDSTQCAKEVADTSNSRLTIFHQCYRKNGQGPEGLYCKLHAERFKKPDIPLFRVRAYHNAIELFHVQRVTDQRYYSDGGGTAKTSQYESVYDTFKEATECLRKRAISKRRSAESLEKEAQNIDTYLESLTEEDLIDAKKTLTPPHK